MSVLLHVSGGAGSHGTQGGGRAGGGGRHSTRSTGAERAATVRQRGAAGDLHSHGGSGVGPEQELVTRRTSLAANGRASCDNKSLREHNVALACVGCSGMIPTWPRRESSKRGAMPACVSASCRGETMRRAREGRGQF